jgi:hypothetical protein
MKAQQIEAFAHGTVEPLAYRGETRPAAAGDGVAHPVFEAIETSTTRRFTPTWDVARALPTAVIGSPRVRAPGPCLDEGRGLSGKVGCPQPTVGRKPVNGYGSPPTGVACVRAPSASSNPTTSRPRAPSAVLAHGRLSLIGTSLTCSRVQPSTCPGVHVSCRPTVQFQASTRVGGRALRTWN